MNYLLFYFVDSSWFESSTEKVTTETAFWTTNGTTIF